MQYVNRNFHFHAAHFDERATDKCGELHGHTYRVCLSVGGDRGREEMLIHGDFLTEVFEERIEPLTDHKFLNKSLSFNPTMENVGDWILEMLKDAVEDLKDPRFHTVNVELWETETLSYETTAFVGTGEFAGQYSDLEESHVNKNFESPRA